MVIFDESGLVSSNNHVIEGGVEIIATQDEGTQLVAEVVGADRLSDLAVLQLSSEPEHLADTPDGGRSGPVLEPMLTGRAGSTIRP